MSRERERFEKLARKMEVTEKQCLAKEEKLSQVRDLIRNSPLSAARTQSIPNTPLRAEKIKDNKTQDGVSLFFFNLYFHHFVLQLDCPIVYQRKRTTKTLFI